MISFTEMGIGAVVAVAAVTVGIRRGRRRVPKYASQEGRRVSDSSEPTLRSALFHETKWTFALALLLMAAVVTAAALEQFERNGAAALFGIFGWAYSVYWCASYFTAMVCLGDRPISAPDFPPTESAS